MITLKDKIILAMIPDNMNWNISIPLQSTVRTTCLTTRTGAKTIPCETPLWQSMPVPRSKELLCGGQARGIWAKPRKCTLTVIERSRNTPNSQLEVRSLKKTALSWLEAGQRR
jgi:hypothetical protein